jgi:hypothetical protein
MCYIPSLTRYYAPSAEWMQSSMMQVRFSTVQPPMRDPERGIGDVADQGLGNAKADGSGLQIVAI